MNLPITNFFLTILLLLMGWASVPAQTPDAFLKKADLLFEQGQYKEAIPIYRKVLMRDNQTEAKIGLANSYRMIRDYEKAEYWYKLVVPKRPMDPIFQFYLAQSLQNNGKYQEAASMYKEYAKVDKNANSYAQACNNTQQFTKDADRYEVSPFPFNSKDNDFGSMYFNNGIVYASAQNPSNPTNTKFDTDQRYSDLYFVKILSSKTYDKPKKLKGKVNSSLNEGPAFFSIDASQILFSKQVPSKTTGKKTEQIFIGERTADASFGKIQEFIHNNDAYSMANPVLSVDNTMLFFASDMPGGYGGHDLYVCERIDTFWSEPLNLGPKINSTGDEAYPFHHPDGTLYYASNGLQGLGGYDIFFATMNGGQWQAPINIGAPINSSTDDFSMVVNEENSAGYFSSNRKFGKGGDDIYMFKVKGSIITASKNAYPYKKPLADAVNPKGKQLALGKAVESNTAKEPKMAKQGDNKTKTQKPAKAKKEKKAKPAKADKNPNAKQKQKKEKPLTPRQLKKKKEREYKEAKQPNIKNNQSTAADTNTPAPPVQEEPTEMEVPKLNTNTSSISGAPSPTHLIYKIHIGPSKKLNKDIVDKFRDLGGELEYKQSEKGTLAIIGSFEAISVAEYAETFIKDKGFKKTAIKVYVGGVLTPLKVKQLKRQGIK